MSPIRLVSILAFGCAALLGAPPARAEDGGAAAVGPIPNPYGSLSTSPDRHLEHEEAYRPLRFELDGYIRIRGDAWGEADLGISGRRPALSGDTWLETANLRVRLSPVLYIAREAAIHLEVDLLDNLVLGSTPDGLPRTSTAPAVGASTTQEPPSAGLNGFGDSIRVKKAFLELPLPIGVLLLGRMGNNWGLGMVASAGDELDDDYDDSVDRIAFVTSLWDHLVALAYDFNAGGPSSATRFDRRGQPFDLTDRDDVRTVSVAVTRFDTEEMRRRRLAAGRFVVNYGLAFSYRWQDMDLPTYYLSSPGEGHEWLPSELVQRGFSAWMLDGWVRLAFPLGGWTLRIEAEGAYTRGSVEHPDPLPNVEANFTLSSEQGACVAKVELKPPGLPLWFGVHAGWASGDPAPGFGVWARPADNGTTALPQAGDLDGLQLVLPTDLNAPRDTAVDNFRFHPNYRVDQILWRRIIGTFTDAWFVRFDIRGYPLPALKLHAGVIYSETLNALSAPGLARPLGVELEAGATYYTRGGFEARVTYAGLLPLDGMRDFLGGVEPKPSHLFRALLAYRF